jgi:hypothetical protein
MSTYLYDKVSCIGMNDFALQGDALDFDTDFH